LLRESSYRRQLYVAVHVNCEKERRIEVLISLWKEGRDVGRRHFCPSLHY
jgi:hypothetical protein